MLTDAGLAEGQGRDSDDMDASNPSPIVQAASPNLPAVLPSSGQAGVIIPTTSPAPDTSAMIAPAALLYQFNIQQSLLMQQYALAQQAAAKAATVKSAAEVAAARAAEISKQLEKKSQSSSTSKSTSRSPLQSKSNSRSKSRSLSPSRKRRVRSNSRSPIRYRRDYHSSYRPRDHYGYRGYNYRSSYRGSYNDYSRYRYGRENYRRRSRSGGRRRSRTRSRSRSRSSRRDRSRGRRRSRSISPPAKNHSHTRSPRDLRRKSVSPHARRDGTKFQHNPVGTVSREAVKSPSVSSRSINASTPAKSRSRSSSQLKPYDEDQSPTTMPSHEKEKERLASVDREPMKGSSVSSHERTRSSSSTARSLSVSLDNTSYRNASDKVAAVRRSVGEYDEPVKMSSSDDHEETFKRMSSDEHGSPGKRYVSKVDESDGWNKHPGGGRRIRKPTRSPNAIFHDEVESSDEIVDDWRDDLKQVVKGKGGPSYKDGEMDRLNDKGRNDMDSSVKGIASDIEPKHESILQGSSPGHSDSAVALEEQDATTYKSYGPVVVPGEEDSLLGERGHVSVLENAKELCEDDQVEQVLDEDVIFEGPKPPSPVCEQRMQRYEARGTDSERQFIDEESPSSKRSAREKEVTGNLRIAKDDNLCTKDSSRRHSHGKKAKDRSRSRDVKKYEGEFIKHEKRRDRHKKYRKRHKSVEEECAEGDGSRRRHKRTHRREKEHGNKEKKKRKHKHRTRSSSVSVDDSSPDSEVEVRSSSRKRKRVSRKHKAVKRDVLKSPPLSSSLG